LSENSIYISYSEKDIDSAKRISDFLKKMSFNTWLVDESIKPGQHVKIEINRAIKNCKYFLALLSSYSVSQRSRVNSEINEALSILDEYPDSSIFIIPIRLEDCASSHEKLSELYPVKLCIDAHGFGQFDRLKLNVRMQLMRQVVSYR